MTFDTAASASDLAKLRRHIRILIDLGRLAGEPNDLDRFLDQVVVQIARAVEIDHTKILEYRRKTGDFILCAGFGWKDGVVRATTLPADLSSPPGLTFQTAEPLVISDINKQHGFELSELLKQHDIVSLANVPILVDGAAWGVLEVDSTVPRDFSEDTISFLSAAGAILGAVLHGHKRATHPITEAAVAVLGERNREVLLQEMQHRVKNNFQLVLASVALQKRRYATPEAQRALDHVANRIMAISLAHDQLAPHQEMRLVSLSDYLRALCLSIRQQTDGIEIDIQADEVELAIDRAVPVGLILNELAMNSIKHAFSENSGRIGVTLVLGVGYGEARLTIADNGRGMKELNNRGSGLKLVASLARQIGGTLTREEADQGTTISLTFPVIV